MFKKPPIGKNAPPSQNKKNQKAINKKNEIINKFILKRYKEVYWSLKMMKKMMIEI
jgi:hypothetical protein